MKRCSDTAEIRDMDEGVHHVEECHDGRERDSRERRVIHSSRWELEVTIQSLRRLEHVTPDWSSTGV